MYNIIDEDLEFNLWTKPDCGGTEFECNYKSWFYFAIKGKSTLKLINMSS
jgi:hypothetical protein